MSICTRNHFLPHHESKTVNDRWGTKRKAFENSIASFFLKKKKETDGTGTDALLFLLR